MPTPLPADKAIQAYWKRELDGPATKDLRIKEAVTAALMGADGISVSDGTITVDLNRMAAVSAKGLRLDATAEGTHLTVFVVGADGKPVKPDLAPGWTRTEGGPLGPEGGLEPGLASSPETG